MLAIILCINCVEILSILFLIIMLIFMYDWSSLTLFKNGGRGGRAKKLLLPIFPVKFLQMQQLPVKTFCILISTFLPHLRKSWRPLLVPVPNYWTSTKSSLHRNWFFWANPYKIEVMITSLIEMLDLSNFGHMTTSTKQFDSRDKVLSVTSWTEIMTS